MGDKVKHVFFDKEIRERAERLELDKYSQELDKMSPEDQLKELQRLKKEIQKIKEEMSKLSDKYPAEKRLVFNEIIELFDVLETVDELNKIKIFRLIEQKRKEFGQNPMGILNRKGKFVCVFCLQSEKYDNPINLQGFDTIIYLYDISNLKTGSFYQCDDCKKKFGLNGITP